MKLRVTNHVMFIHSIGDEILSNILFPHVLINCLLGKPSRLAGQNVTLTKVVFKIHFKPF